jgi:hypothetical protein
MCQHSAQYFGFYDLSHYFFFGFSDFFVVHNVVLMQRTEIGQIRHVLDFWDVEAGIIDYESREF